MRERERERETQLSLLQCASAKRAHCSSVRFLSLDSSCAKEAKKLRLALGNSPHLTTFQVICSPAAHNSSPEPRQTRCSSRQAGVHPIRAHKDMEPVIRCAEFHEACNPFESFVPFALPGVGDVLSCPWLDRRCTFVAAPKLPGGLAEMLGGGGSGLWVSRDDPRCLASSGSS